MNKKCKSEEKEVTWKSPLQEVENESGFGMKMAS